MFNQKQETIILSVGGSLVAPNGIDTQFLKKLNTFIRTEIKKGKRFLIVIGGGHTARSYRDAGKNVIGKLTDEDLDWIGIHSTRLNAHLIRTIFQDIAHPRIIENYDHKLQNWVEPIAIGAGWKPGWSTDYCAVTLAKDYHASIIINLSNIDWVYDKDPKKYKDAQKIKKTTWTDFEEIVGDTWKPGINSPFDPIASKLAKKLNLTVIVANGNNFKNLSNILEGTSFKGTVITPLTVDASFYDRDYFRGLKNARMPYIQPFFITFVHFFANWYRALWIRFIINPKNCLDVGCGTGELVKNLRKLGIETVGIEISEYALEVAQKEVKPYLTYGDITKIPYDDDSFDVVVTFNVLEHIDRALLKKAILETVRVSRKHIVHKMYTIDNWLSISIKGRQIFHSSVMNSHFWLSLFRSIEQVAVVRSFFKLPSAIETIFILRKNKV